MDNLKEIEQKEFNYFNEIDFNLSHDLNKMIVALNSKDKIKKDWIDSFKRADKKRQNSDFARGAERVYFWLLNKFGTPNSSPVGADLMFEVWDAFVHIDIKTAKVSNKSDYKGKVPIGENQTSYKSKNFNSNLPFFYTIEKENKSKICLTYILNIIYDDKSENFKVLAVILVAVPNGKLKKIYRDHIIGAGKSKGRSFRYEYKENPYFQLIKEKPLRIKSLHIDPQYKESYFTNIKEVKKY